jgi:hypothetical protein|tara:strand:+ start:317 stop:529 length:213 start_codon:yes stop_codon:yes gene_type:complete
MEWDLAPISRLPRHQRARPSVFLDKLVANLKKKINMLLSKAYYYFSKFAVECGKIWLIATTLKNAKKNTL